MKVPPKFKVPVFDKYNGTTCPKTHIRAYFRKMSAYSDDGKLLMYFFQDSLAGASLEWYMKLERSCVKNWKDLAEAFLKQYQYNIDMAPNRTQLQSLSQKNNESFKEYAQRWRELAARVQPPMIEREMVDMFMGTLQGSILQHLAGGSSSGFSDMVISGERVENLMRLGKLPGNEGSSSNIRKPFVDV